MVARGEILPFIQGGLSYGRTQTHLHRLDGCQSIPTPAADVLVQDPPQSGMRLEGNDVATGSSHERHDRGVLSDVGADVERPFPWIQQATNRFRDDAIVEAQIQDVQADEARWVDADRQPP